VQLFEFARNISESDNHWFPFFKQKKIKITARPCYFRKLKRTDNFHERTHKEEAVLWAVI
jgi:hypothetical protein